MGDTRIGDLYLVFGGSLYRVRNLENNISFSEHLANTTRLMEHVTNGVQSFKDLLSKMTGLVPCDHSNMLAYKS
jgi:hypothetical protein